MKRLRYLAWLGLGLWVGAIFLLIPLAGKTSGAPGTEATLNLPRSAEVTRELVREQQAFPGTDTPVAVIVYVRPTGITAADRAAVDADRSAFAVLSRDNAVPPAVTSADRQALLLSFPVAADDKHASAIVKQIKARLADTPAGLAVAVTGSAGALADGDEVFGGVETTLLLAAAGVVAVLLLITYRSPVLWVVPLVCVGLASQLASGLVYLLARFAGVPVADSSRGIMVVLVFGAGTDYALLLIARYREELRRHADRYAAMAMAWRRSFPAILASAATIGVGLLCLLFAQVNAARGMGPVAAAGIIVTFAVVTTLMPILLVLLGRWLFWPFIPRYSPGADPGIVAQHGIWHRLAERIGRRPRPVWTVTALVLAVLTLGVFGLRFTVPADQIYTKPVDSVAGQLLIAAHYPQGTSYPARILAAAGSADRVVASAAAVPGVSVARQVDLSADGRWVRIDAVLTDPADSAAAEATVDRLRTAVHAVPGADALISGQTATTIDVRRAADHDNALVMPLILVAVLVVLVLVLRALVAPVLLVASVVLSYAAAMGAAAWVLQALGHRYMDPTLPLWTFLFLVTLGVDYTIFLMTRAREEVGKVGHRAGILSALTVTGAVITSAGTVLAATFATLTVLPAVTPLQVGLIVALGVLLDTAVVRTLLVPTLAIDVGTRFWWPGRPVHVLPQRRPSRATVDLAA
jgi:RND superfamily putative drug exporter